MDEQVNIPALLIVFNGGTLFIIWSVFWLYTLVAIRVVLGKSGTFRPKVAWRVIYGELNFMD